MLQLKSSQDQRSFDHFTLRRSACLFQTSSDFVEILFRRFSGLCVCMALHTVVSVARFCAANKILESKAPLLSAGESTGQESVRLVHVVVAVSVSGILGFSYRRIMSDATLMHYLGILVFTGLSIVYVWEGIVVTC